MGFLSALGKIGKIAGAVAGVAGAPFTGGASLALTAASIGGDIAGTIIGNRQISKAANAQIGSIDEARTGLSTANTNAANTLRAGQTSGQGFAQQGLDDIRNANQPYRDVGQEALYSLRGMMNDEGTPFEFDPASVSKYLDPSLGFVMDEAMKALSRSAAGGGRLRSGGTLKALQDRGTQIALKYGWEPAMNRAYTAERDKYASIQDNSRRREERLFGLSEMGRGATSETNQATQRFSDNMLGLEADTSRMIAGNELQTADRIAGLTTDRGDVQASGSIAQANNLRGGISNVSEGIENLISLRNARKPRTPNYNPNALHY